MRPAPRKPTRPAVSTANVVEVAGPTIQQAIQKALVLLQARRNDVRVKILSEGEPGLFGMHGSKPAKVRVSRKAPTPQKL